MSREIKFRVYQRGEMRPLAGTRFDDNGAMSGWTDPVMQFTGLKDKNGKEIYEGDVVRCQENENDLEEDIVTAEIAYFGDKQYPAFDLKNIDQNESNGLSYWLNLGTIEIIGNIYENPDLLKT